jgi:hypothetical protein
MFLRWLIYLHVAAGFVGLAAFWVPIFTKKGAANHRKFGKVFKYCAYIVLGAAIFAVGFRLAGALLQGIGPRDNPVSFAFVVFLGYLAVVTLIGMRHGFVVLEAKADLGSLNTPLNSGLAKFAIACSLLLIAYGLYYRPPNQILLYALSPVGFLNGFGIRSAIMGKRQERKAWFYEHMNGLIVAGIAFHTAFAVFGVGQLINLGLEGWLAVIPWIAPTLIGVPAGIIWTRYYQRKFNQRKFNDFSVISP